MLYREARAILQEIGHLRWEAVALHNLGGLSALRGELDKAEGFTRAALHVARRRRRGDQYCAYATQPRAHPARER